MIAKKKAPAAKKKPAAAKKPVAKKKPAAAAKKRPAPKKPVTKKPAPKKATAKKPVARKPAAKKAAAKKPVAKKPAAAKKPVAAKKPAAAKKPVAKKPVAAAKKPRANKQPVAAAKKPVAKTPVAAAKKPLANKQPAVASKKPSSPKKPISTAVPRYPFVAVDVREPYAGELAALLFANGALGVEERDDNTLRRGPSHGIATVVGAFATHEAARAAIAAVRVSRPILRPRLEEVVGDGWRDAWKEHFAPFALTPRVTIAPPWSTPPKIPGARVLVLEPGRAFGTGLHASTSLVAALLEERSPTFAGRTVLDVGTGSGILALTAIVLGAARCLALDVDEDAVAVARENVRRNQLSSHIEVRPGSAADAHGRFDLVLANIEARVLLPMAEDLAARVSPSGTLILSGILATERPAILARYEPLGFTHTRTLQAGEAAGEAWIAIALTGPSR